MARFYQYVVLQDVISVVSIASRTSGQLGAPTVPGRRGAIGMRLGYVLEHAVCCSTLFLWSDWTLSSWRKNQRKIGALPVEHYFWICRCLNWVQAPGTQRPGKYCKEMSRCIPHTWKNARFCHLFALQYEFLSCPASPIVSNRERPPFPEEVERSDRSEIRVCFRAYQILLNAVFTTRLDHVLLGKRLAENWRSGRYFWICRCRNQVQGPRDQRNIVELERVCIWIVQTWNGEIPPIIEPPPLFSVEIAVAVDQNGCFF
jgi:hypothetical protein